MSKSWIWMVGLMCCVALTGVTFAEGPAEWAGLKKADRQTAQKAFKANLELKALEGGWQGKRAFAPAGRQAAAPNKALGTITYHSGALGTCCQNSFMVGNQFDSALDTSGTVIAPVEMSGSVTAASFDMISVGGSAAFLSMFDNVNGTTANFITSVLKSGLVTGLNNVTIGGGGTANVYSGSSFLAGVWQFNTDVPAVATGTVGGQGFHGISINDIVGTQFTTLSTLNAAFSVSGDVLTPVELLNFDVE